MRLKHAFIALTCLAVQIQHADAKSFLGSGAEARLRRSTEMSVDYERLYRRMAEPQQPSRTTEVVSSSPTATASGTTAVTTESAGNTTAACENVLTALSGAIMSPTGMSVCFDVTELDTTTGIFMSMVLLYQVAPASGNWTVIDNQSLNVDIAYSGANLTSMGVASRSITDPQLAKRAITNTPADVPVLITTQSFMGQVMQGWSTTNITQQMTSLSPTVIVTAKTPSGAPLNSTLPKTEAAFVTGFFSKTAQVQAAAASSAAANTPFVLPGVVPAFFPIGGIVTGAWVFLFTLTVGLGTIGRWQFRRDFRARRGRIGAPITGVGGGGFMPGGLAAYDRR